ncbi:hypothetical protein [Nocardia sp. NPDC051832]|uniref:hypothetical protein n=1 Tax=Nocardia sp. NPDC051832 TaxID=3155673 RepID=UPI003449F308
MLVFAMGVAAVCGDPGVSVAAEQQLIPLAGGMGVALPHGVPMAEARLFHLCTLTAVGYDARDNLIGITNAHCVYDDDGHQWLGDEVLAHSAVAVASGPREPIGRVAHISGGNPIIPGPNGIGLDYAVIVFDRTKVVASATVAGVPIRRIAPPPPPGTHVCKQGITTGLTCGVVLGTNGPYVANTIAEGAGDSGAPVVAGDALIATQWVTGAGTAMVDILSDLDRRGGPGAGFRLATA